MSPENLPKLRRLNNRAAIANGSRCCLLILSASCDSGDLDCAARAVHRMSLHLAPSPRTFVALRSLSFDRRQQLSRAPRNRRAGRQFPLVKCLHRRLVDNQSSRPHRRSRTTRLNRALPQQNLPKADLSNCSNKRYSITSSAVASNATGIFRLSALAVLRLMASSNLVGCCTGRSLGFAPFKILSTVIAPR